MLMPSILERIYLTMIGWTLDSQKLTKLCMVNMQDML